MSLTMQILREKLPACCLCAYENLLADSGKPDNLRDMLDAIEHELTMYAEGQDGCITAKERNECIEFKEICLLGLKQSKGAA